MAFSVGGTSPSAALAGDLNRFCTGAGPGSTVGGAAPREDGSGSSVSASLKDSLQGWKCEGEGDKRPFTKGR